MKGIGYVRRVDGLGRIVLPVEWRRVHDVVPGQLLEIVPGLDGALRVQ